MDKAIELLFTSFTRYFIPGLVFSFAALLLPLALADPMAVSSALSQASIGTVLLFSLVAGYLLDSVGAYRWTFLFRRYRKVRGEFTQALIELTKKEAIDPDQHLAQLWLERPQDYERVFLERAEWVLILESSFALWLSAVVSLLIGFSMPSRGVSSMLLHAGVAAILLFLSYFSADKGIQRMGAHNTKVLVALEHLLAKAAPK